MAGSNKLYHTQDQHLERQHLALAATFQRPKQMHGKVGADTESHLQVMTITAIGSDRMNLIQRWNTLGNPNRNA
jgi:hypothetical protein